MCSFVCHLAHRNTGTGATGDGQRGGTGLSTGYPVELFARHGHIGVLFGRHRFVLARLHRGCFAFDGESVDGAGPAGYEMPHRRDMNCITESCRGAGSVSLV